MTKLKTIEKVKNIKIEIKNKLKQNKKSKEPKSDKRFVIFDLNKCPQNYNEQILSNYANAIGVGPLIMGIEIGEMHNHLLQTCISPEQREKMLGLWNRLLDFYIEAGTWNGYKKAVKFKFNTITEEQKKALESKKKKIEFKPEELADLKELGLVPATNPEKQKPVAYAG